MPIISMFYGIIISMNYNDHNPPHVHVRYAGKVALVSIEGKLLRGELPKSKLRMVQVWCEIHRDELAANWELASEHEGVFRIEPLK